MQQPWIVHDPPFPTIFKVTHGMSDKFLKTNLKKKKTSCRGVSKSPQLLKIEIALGSSSKIMSTFSKTSQNCKQVLILSSKLTRNIK
jgi:hypothetical protein